MKSLKVHVKLGYFKKIIGLMKGLGQQDWAVNKGSGAGVEVALVVGDHKQGLLGPDLYLAREVQPRAVTD